MVLVVGDVMLDQFMWGDVLRISPEAPVPVFNVKSESFAAGGASNVARNVVALGGRAIVVGIIGNDHYGELFKQTLSESDIDPSYLIEHEDTYTTLKTRIIARGQQLLRVDREDVLANGKVSDKVVRMLRDIRESVGVDVIAVSDYNKGVVTGRVMRHLLSWSREEEIPLIVDPKPANRLLYRGVFLCTPNMKEAEGMSGINISSRRSLHRAANKIMKELKIGRLLITQGEEGMTLFEEGKKPFHIEAYAKEVFDVTGAGDTVVATISVMLGSGLDLKESCVLANKAAGIVVGKVGTAVVERKELGI